MINYRPPRSRRCGPLTPDGRHGKRRPLTQGGSGGGGVITLEQAGAIVTGAESAGAAVILQRSDCPSSWLASPARIPVVHGSGRPPSGTTRRVSLRCGQQARDCRRLAPQQRLSGGEGFRPVHQPLDPTVSRSAASRCSTFHDGASDRATGGRAPWPRSANDQRGTAC